MTYEVSLNLRGGMVCEPVKQCVECYEYKALGEFSPKKGAKFGVRSECKECRRAISAKKRSGEIWVTPVEIAYPDGLKLCNECGKSKFVSDFGKDGNGGLRGNCRECHTSSAIAGQKAARETNKTLEKTIPESKYCWRCKVIKYSSLFNFDKGRKDGLSQVCRNCSNEDKRQRRAILSRQEKSIPSEKICCGCKELKKSSEFVCWSYSEDGLYDYCNVCNKIKKDEYRKNNPHVMVALGAKRRASKREATPSWLTEEHHKQIEAIYEDAAWITKLTGIRHEVDHTHPVQGKGFTGLHVPWNLRIITKSENSGKCNRPPLEEAHLFWGNG